MASRWLFVRIRAAERALQDGRIDEAFAAATQADVREHRRGGRLLDELARPLAARARLHVQAGRLPAALADLDKLRAIGRSGPDAEELRQRVSEQMRGGQQQAAADAAAYAKAAENLDAGRLESGRLAIERVDDTVRREELREQLDVRVERSAQLLAHASDALGRGDVLSAVRLWQEARQRHGRDQVSDEFGQRLRPAYRQSLEDWLAQGRIEALLAGRAGLAALAELDPTLTEYEQIATLCARGTTQLGNRDYAGLRETVLRLKAARGTLGWLDAVLASLGRLGEAQDALLASPFGLSASTGGKPDAVMPDGIRRAAGGIAAETRAARRMGDAHAAPVTARPLLLLVDGAGSSLLLPQDAVRIGRAGGSQPIDVPIPAEIQSHHADLVRDGEDYFLTAHGPVSVNQREVKRTLLYDGDRIVLGDAVKLVFRRASVKSDSAVLQLSHRCRLAQDVGEVILFRDTCLIGPLPSCHIRTPEGNTQVVLFDRDGRLHGREAAVHGGKLGDARPLALGQTCDFGDVRITVKSYDPSECGGRA